MPGNYKYILIVVIFVINYLNFMQALATSLDFIIDTVSADHSFDLYLSLLKTAGVLVMVGAPNEVKLKPHSLILGNLLKSCNAPPPISNKRTTCNLS